MKKIIFTTFILLIILPFIMADIPSLPNEKAIPINHRITNMNEYPEYIFFAAADPSGGPGINMCPLEIIESDGLVRYNHYKLCNVAIYGIIKSDIAESQLKAMNESELQDLLDKATLECCTQGHAFILSRNLRFSKVVSDSSTQIEENVTHTLDAWTFRNNNKDNKTCPVGSTNEKGICKKTLSNGRIAEIKIMPETASERAIGALGNIGFNITLKEVGNADEAKSVYELTGNKQGKFLGIFKITAKVQAQVNAESGEVKVIKPWWSFLTSGI